MQWNIDGASIIGFSVKHLMVATVRGRFRKISGTVNWDDENPANSTLEAVVETSSVETDDKLRDLNLRSSNFFDTKSFPYMVFKSKEVRQVGKNKFKLIGDLTIKNKTREVAFDVEYAGKNSDPFAGSNAVFKAQTQINRKDFGLGWSAAIEAGGITVGEQVKIELAVRILKQAALVTGEKAESAA